jgi:hypothetical protein
MPPPKRAKIEISEAPKPSASHAPSSKTVLDCAIIPRDSTPNTAPRD